MTTGHDGDPSGAAAGGEHGPPPGPADAAGAHAEADAAELRNRLTETERALDEARSALDAAERRREIDRVLIESEAIDLETARLLTEAAVSAMDDVDVARAVADLRARKPFLFGAAPGRHGPMGPSEDPPAQDRLRRLAEAAGRTGDRGALVAYLRARRAARTGG